ncbi:MAG: hypothetical protein ACHP6I_02230 [Rickettsiales bacterium]
MLSWRIEEVDFSTGFKHSRFISVSLHVLFILVCLIIGEYSINFLHTKFNEEPDSIELEIVNKMGEIKTLPMRKKEIAVNERAESPLMYCPKNLKPLPSSRR